MQKCQEKKKKKSRVYRTAKLVLSKGLCICILSIIKGISVYIHLYWKVRSSLVQLWREAPCIWDDFVVVVDVVVDVVVVFVPGMLSYFVHFKPFCKLISKSLL